MPNEVNFDLLHVLLDSLKEPVLFADTEHIVGYMNRAAIEFYSGGDKLLGSNLLDCHNQQSQQQMLDILRKMAEGLEEELITDNEKWRIYMRAVRSVEGELLGYYERFEPPK